MNEANKLIERKLCFVCKVKIIKPRNQYCKACKLIGPKKVIFYSYNINSDINKAVKLSKGKMVYNIESPLPKINFIYYHTPQEMNILQKLKFQRFRNIEELTSFIFASNQIPVFHLVFNFSKVLMLIPQISAIVNKNKHFIPKGKEQIKVNKAIEARVEVTDLSLVYDPKFWEDLIRLYLINHHIYCAFFHLKDLQAKKLSQPLLTAIYYMGYLCRSHKPAELTDYMTKLAKNQLKKILFKPSLQNIQALCIYFYTFYTEGEYKLAIAILAQLTRMCYSIGLHIDTNMFLDCINYNRKILISKVARINKNISGCLKLRPNYLVDVPRFDSSLYDPRWHLLDPKFKLENFDLEDRIILSNITTIHSRFCDNGLTLASFNDISTNLESVAELYLIKLKNLSLAYSAAKKSYSQLIEIYPNSNMIKEIMEYTENVNYTLQNDILEYWLLKGQINPRLIQKILEYSSDILQTQLEISGRRFNIYLFICISFAYFKIFNHSTQTQKSIIINNLKIIRSYLNYEMDDYYSLSYLLFKFKFESIINK